MEKRIKRIVIFLVLNFIALGIGGLFTGEAVGGDWYLSLAKAPWTPPGWVFGAAWTTIMICYAIYMAFVWEVEANKKLLVGMFAAQWILNVLWNPIFFEFHLVLLGLITISALTILMGYYLKRYCSSLNWKSALILPYFVWLLIATSLNAYIFLNN